MVGGSIHLHEIADSENSMMQQDWAARAAANHFVQKISDLQELPVFQRKWVLADLFEALPDEALLEAVHNISTSLADTVQALVGGRRAVVRDFIESCEQTTLNEALWAEILHRDEANKEAAADDAQTPCSHVALRAIMAALSVGHRGKTETKTRDVRKEVMPCLLCDAKPLPSLTEEEMNDLFNFCIQLGPEQREAATVGVHVKFLGAFISPLVLERKLDRGPRVGKITTKQIEFARFFAVGNNLVIARNAVKQLAHLKRKEDLPLIEAFARGPGAAERFYNELLARHEEDEGGMANGDKEGHTKKTRKKVKKGSALKGDEQYGHKHKKKAKTDQVKVEQTKEDKQSEDRKNSKNGSKKKKRKKEKREGFGYLEFTCLHSVFEILDPVSLCKASMVCTHWHQTSLINDLWVHLLDIGIVPGKNSSFSFSFCHPVPNLSVKQTRK